jgi:4-hydroxythreonine-4-phosphate dehydrogenase
VSALVLTMGEPAGIGGEITLKAWLRRGEQLPEFFVVDDADRLQAIADALGMAVPVIRVTDPALAGEVFSSALPVLHQAMTRPVHPGAPDAANAPGVIGSIETAVSLTLSGHARGVVTNPIHKKTLYAAGFRHPGHTEFLAHLAGDGITPVMMLVGPELRVIPVTVHVPLADAINALSTYAIVRAGVIADAALRRDFGLASPRLAVAGLNPHAGEEKTIGGEDGELIAPAVAALRDQGIDAFGPLSPDTMFSPRSRRLYDAALCMYHDQALIPLKTLDVDGGVNVTLGLPFVRTSPDHGTAFDIAGQGIANENSLISALRLADALARRRAVGFT